MKLRILRVLLVSLLVSSMTLPLFACDGGKTPDEGTVESTTESVNTTTEVTTEEVTEEVTEIPRPTEVSLPEGYTNPDITYNCQDDSVLYTYAGKTEENFNAVLDGYKAQGFRVYSDVTKNGSRFTYVKDYTSHGKAKIVIGEKVTIPSEYKLNYDYKDEYENGTCSGCGQKEEPTDNGGGFDLPADDWG